MVSQIRIIITIIIYVIKILYPTLCYSSPYIPKTGTYRYIFSSGIIDESSSKKIEQKISLFSKIQDDMYALEQVKLTNTWDQNLDSTKRKIATINEEINSLEESAKQLNSSNETNMSHFETEYGATDRKSFGLAIDYSSSNFVETKNYNIHRKEYVSHNAGFFLKQNLFQNDNFIVTISPKIHQYIYDKKTGYKTDISLMLGYSKQHKKSKNFQIFTITSRKYFDKTVKNTGGYLVSLTEGIELKNGIIVSNYTEYEFKNKLHPFNRTTIYEQISVAKPITFGNLTNQKFTLQIGYFWKGNTVSSLFTISGPIFSLWLNI